MFIKIKCKYLQLFLDKSEIEIKKLKPLDNDFYEAFDYKGTIFYFTFKEGGLCFDNYKENPSITFKNGTQIWMTNNRIHRNNDLPAVVLKNDFEFYFKNNKPHRDGDHPAVILPWHSSFKEIFTFSGYRFENRDGAGFRLWCKDGELHRVNRHAFIHNIEHEKDMYFLFNEIVREVEDFKKHCLQINVGNF